MLIFNANPAKGPLDVSDGNVHYSAYTSAGFISNSYPYDRGNAIERNGDYCYIPGNNDLTGTREHGAIYKFDYNGKPYIAGS